MFTVEHEYDHTKIVVLGDGENFEDVEIIMDEDMIFIRQFDEEVDGFDLVTMSPAMWQKVLAAQYTPAGVFNIVELADG